MSKSAKNPTVEDTNFPPSIQRQLKKDYFLSNKNFQIRVLVLETNQKKTNFCKFAQKFFGRLIEC